VLSQVILFFSSISIFIAPFEVSTSLHPIEVVLPSLQLVLHAVFDICAVPPINIGTRVHVALVDEVLKVSLKLYLALCAGVGHTYLFFLIEIKSKIN